MPIYGDPLFGSRGAAYPKLFLHSRSVTLSSELMSRLHSHLIDEFSPSKPMAELHVVAPFPQHFVDLWNGNPSNRGADIEDLCTRTSS